jgi:hypothetical protein
MLLSYLFFPEVDVCQPEVDYVDMGGVVDVVDRSLISILSTGV